MAAKKSKTSKAKTKVEPVAKMVEEAETVKVQDVEKKDSDDMFGSELDPQEEKMLDWILKIVVAFILGWLGLSVILVVLGYFGVWK